MTIHTCSICGRPKECNDYDGPCTMPKILVMNCGVETGHPYHQEEYCKAVDKERHNYGNVKNE